MTSSPPPGGRNRRCALNPPLYRGARAVLRRVAGAAGPPLPGPHRRASAPPPTVNGPRLSLTFLVTSWPRGQLGYHLSAVTSCVLSALLAPPRPSGSVDTGRDTFGIPFAFPPSPLQGLLDRLTRARHVPVSAWARWVMAGPTCRRHHLVNMAQAGQQAVASGYVSAEQFDQIVNPVRMVGAV